MELRDSTSDENDAAAENVVIVEAVTEVQGQHPLCMTDAIAIRVEGSTLSVIAPASLPPGYELSVHDENGQPYVVEVPEGGVSARELFSARILREGHVWEPENPQSIPVGHWRDECSDCCRFGCWHPLCCLAFWCTPLALGQLMSRMKLNLIGSPVHPDPKAWWTPFKQITAIYLGFLLVFTAVAHATGSTKCLGSKNDAGDKSWMRALDTIHFIAHIGFFVYFLFAMIRTRSYLRKKYEIPTLCCGKCEDFCCTLCCSPCTVCHMARHTADYSKYRASCCSDNGLTTYV